MTLFSHQLALWQFIGNMALEWAKMKTVLAFLVARRMAGRGNYLVILSELQSVCFKQWRYSTWPTHPHPHPSAYGGFYHYHLYIQLTDRHAHFP